MKAVVVEIAERYAVVLDSKGSFIKIKNNGRLKVGYEVELPHSSGFNMNTFMKTLAVAAIFLLVIGFGFGIYSYNVPYTYVSVDINPSVEFTTNIFNRIIKTEGLNEDGRKLLLKENYKNEAIEDGVEGILKWAADEGYFDNKEKNAVMVTVASKSTDKSEGLKDNLENAVSQELKVIAKPDVEKVVQTTTVQKRNEAHKQGVSQGKLKLVEELKDIMPEAKTEELINKPVKTILDTIKNVKKDTGKAETVNNTGGKITKNSGNTVIVTGKDNTKEKDKSQNTGLNKIGDVNHDEVNDKTQKEKIRKEIKEVREHSNNKASKIVERRIKGNKSPYEQENDNCENKKIEGNDSDPNTSCDDVEDCIKNNKQDSTDKKWYEKHIPKDGDENDKYLNNKKDGGISNPDGDTGEGDQSRIIKRQDNGQEDDEDGCENILKKKNEEKLDEDDNDSGCNNSNDNNNIKKKSNEDSSKKDNKTKETRVKNRD